MVQAIRKRVSVGAGGVVEVRDPQLREGAEAEVIVLVEQPAQSPEPHSSFESMVGAAKGVFASPEAIDDYIRGLRDEWD